MKIHAPAHDAAQHGAPAVAPALQQPSQTASVREVAHPEAIALQRLHNMGSDSPRTTQLKSLQAMVNASPLEQALQAMQAVVNHSTAAIAQRRVANNIAAAPFQQLDVQALLRGKFGTAQRAEDEELLQGKLQPVQRAENEELKPNNTGLPDQLKSGIESLSGMGMDHVKVHYNSDKPAQLQAHAYAQGSEIHVAPGQERHVPHEAWHVVQQAQGRVRPTMQMKGGLPVNDDVGLESEADVMGAKALQMQVSQDFGDLFCEQPHQLSVIAPSSANQKVLQPVWIDYNLGNILMWDRKQQGIRWYYIVKEARMYYQIESPDDLKRALGIPLDLEENSPIMTRLRDSQGMENSLARQDWMGANLFDHEEYEPNPVPVVKIEEVSRQITRELQTPTVETLHSSYSGVDASSALNAPVEHVPLFKIIHDTARSQGINLWELELRLGSPVAYFNSFTEDKANAGKASGLNFSDLEVGNIETFTDYVRYLTEAKKLTGSCGQTSAWIHLVTGGLRGGGGQETPLPVRDFLEVLDAHKSRPFYMRVLTGGHSFIIENSGTAMAIYQSWHGSAPMALMLEKGLNLMSSEEMLQRLEDVLLPKNSLTRNNKHRDEASKVLFYGQDHKDPTPLVWFNLNLAPLSPEQIEKNIEKSLAKYRAQWEYVLKGGDLKKMEIAEQQDDWTQESPPKDMSQIFGEKGLSMDLHKGLMYLHAEQIELRDDPEGFKPAAITAPEAKGEYVFRSALHNHLVLSSFIITADDIEGEVDDPTVLNGPVVRGKLMPKNYQHKATKRFYELKKSGVAMQTVYTFTLI